MKTGSPYYIWRRWYCCYAFFHPVKERGKGKSFHSSYVKVIKIFDKVLSNLHWIFWRLWKKILFFVKTLHVEVDMFTIKQTSRQRRRCSAGLTCKIVINTLTPWDEETNMPTTKNQTFPYLHANQCIFSSKRHWNFYSLVGDFVRYDLWPQIVIHFSFLQLHSAMPRKKYHSIG